MNLFFTKNKEKKIFYPDINYKEGEDLNIDNMKSKYLKLHWFDLKKFPTIKSMSKSMAISERRIYQLVKKLELPSRKIKNGIK